MNKKIRLSIALVAVLGAAIPAGIVLAQGSSARVTIEDARARAVREVPGSVLAEELEREGGRLVYSFEIRPNGNGVNANKEVTIDANSGSVVSIESADDEGDDHEEERGKEGADNDRR